MTEKRKKRREKRKANREMKAQQELAMRCYMRRTGHWFDGFFWQDRDDPLAKPEGAK